MSSAKRQFPCKNCGASLVFEPGAAALKCPYCGVENEIAQQQGRVVVELDFRTALSNLVHMAETRDVVTFRCDGCGAESSFNNDQVSGKCSFCGHGIVATGQSKKLIRPGSLLPFHVTKEQAAAAFVRWVASLWFAPNALKHEAQRSGIDGAYIPAWTYDAWTMSNYRGQRGDDYWDTETYTERDANGNTFTRTRQVRKTRWSYVSGSVPLDFDDVLVLASRSLPEKIARRLEPWDLPNLVPYRDEYLSGFVCESYQVDVKDGFEQARVIMDEAIRGAIVRHIGGDHQRIEWHETQFGNITYKHLLLPIWISAYQFQRRTFRFLVNARTGDVQGERPWSVAKIVSLVAVIVAVVIGIILLATRS